MLAFAYSECGLSVDEFFRLSWYEWSLELYKVKQRRKDEHSRWELNAMLARDIMSLIWNTAGKSTTRNLEPKDFLKLSFDNETESKEKLKLTPNQVTERFPDKLPKLKKVGK